MKIRLHDEKKNVRVLGPGKRYVIWLQGCKKSCPGCMSVESRALDGGYLENINRLAKRIIGSECQGLTVSGGEPFLQATALSKLIDEMKKYKDIGIIIYTGYTYEELCGMEDAAIRRVLEQTDLLIDGPYIEELNDGKFLRGSSNQRSWFLTDRYEDVKTDYGIRQSSVEFYFSSDKICMVGIPAKDIMSRIKEN